MLKRSFLQSEHVYIPLLLVFIYVPLSAQSPSDAEGWWMEEPVRLLQVNLPAHMAAELDPVQFVEQVRSFPANTLLLNMGGIVANYPTKMPFHAPNDDLEPGEDFFGKVLEEAHRHGIRVIGRFDFSRAETEIFKAHPEWFFRKADGTYSADANGLVTACINGGYYRRAAFDILEEALSLYPVDGLFFNWFGNQPVNWYTGEVLGTCRCDECRKRFLARFGRSLPDQYEDPDYLTFMRESSHEVADSIASLIKSLRPQAAFMTYLDEIVDVIMDESKGEYSSIHPLWPYYASVNTNRARSEQPARMIFDLVINFQEFHHRFASVPGAFSAASLYQNMAHGAVPAYTVVGTLDQPDPSGMNAARMVFAWHAAHEDLYVGQENEARVILLGSNRNDPNTRGIIRLLSELHIPFSYQSRLEAGTWKPEQTDLVISTGRANPNLESYLAQGGNLLLTGTTIPDLPGLPGVVRQWTTDETNGAYWRVRNTELLPSLKPDGLLFVKGPVLEMRPVENPPLTLVPPSTYSPPDKVFFDAKETAIPGLVLTNHGKGRLLYLPWNLGELYYTSSAYTHRTLFSDLVDLLLPAGRQLKTDAHPLVEITVTEQPAQKRTLVHLINLSGRSGTAAFDPIPMQNITIQVHGQFSEARDTATGSTLPTNYGDGYTRFTLSNLNAYDVVELRK